MTTNRTPRIVIEDLPEIELLSEEEAARIFGAGRVRLNLEQLETREVMSASAFSTLGGLAARFDLQANHHLVETIGSRHTDLGSGALALFQSHDNAGHQVAYTFGNGHLVELTPAGPAAGVNIASPRLDQVVQDQGLDLFFQQGGNLFEATGVPAAGSTGELLVASNVQATYQGKDAAGQPTAYTLEGGQLYLVDGKGLHAFSGLSGVTQAAVDGQGQLYALQSSGNLWAITGGSGQRVATGVTQMAVDPAKEIVVLKGPNAYQYLGGALTVGTGGADAAVSGTATSYALDGIGQLYRLDSKGVLSVSTSKASGFHQVATGVTQMAVSSYGDLVTLSGPHSYRYYPTSGLGTGGSSSGAVYTLDAKGQLYALQGGTVTVQANSVSSPTTVGRSGVAAADGSIWYLGLQTADAAGDHAIYHASSGKVTQLGVTSPAIWTKWLGTGGPSGSLGLPVGSATRATDSAGRPVTQNQMFQYGSIAVTPQGVVSVSGLPSGGGTGLVDMPVVISSDGVDQRKSPTCVFLSSLASVARTDPQLLRQHIQWSGSDIGGWHVTLFDATLGNWRTIQVNFSAFKLGDPDLGFNNQNAWVAIYQRAYLQLMKVDTSNPNPDLWNAPGDTFIPAAGVFAGEWKDPKVALQALTGVAVHGVPLTPATTWQGLQTALQQGMNVVATTKGATDKQMIAAAPGLVGNHAYEVIRVDPPITTPPGSLSLTAQPAMVTLRNPWGYDPDGQLDSQGDGKSDGYITLPWSEFEANFTEYYANRNS